MSEKILDRVRALLAKAESTEFPEEAEALSAKAVELMARHNIEEATLAARGAKGDDPVESKTITLEDPHAKVKMVLLHRVATPLNCKPIYITANKHAVLFGHRSDIERVEFLYTSLLLQATRAMTKVRPEPERYFDWRIDEYQWRKASPATVASYRRSWLQGFAQRVGERLQEATKQAVQEHGQPGTALVLRNRLQDAAAGMRQAYPRTGRMSVSNSRHDGYGAGQAAGSRADIGQRRVSGSRTAIGG